LYFSTHIMREAEKPVRPHAIMHRGCILAERDASRSCRNRHEQPDLEGFFFQLIFQHDGRLPAATAAPS